MAEETMVECVSVFIRNLIPSGKLGPVDQETSDRIAKAAIAAMRKPTLQMVLAGCRRAKQGRELADEYSAMIDEALK